jgi:hypothetical protein
LYADDLNTPLGQDQDRQSAKRPPAVARIVVTLLVLCGVAAAGWALFTHNPFGGDAVAIAPAKPEPKADKALPEAAPSTTGALPTKPVAEPPAGSKTITIIDGATGARKDVVVPQ